MFKYGLMSKRKKPKSPADLAISKPEKKTYSFSLLTANVAAIEKLVDDANKAGGTKAKVVISHVVDEAIAFYLESMKSGHQPSRKK